MIVYLTPYNPATRLPTAASEDCGFDSLADAVAAFGEDGLISVGKRIAVYAEFALTVGYKLCI